MYKEDIHLRAKILYVKTFIVCWKYSNEIVKMICRQHTAIFGTHTHGEREVAGEIPQFNSSKMYDDFSSQN